MFSFPNLEGNLPRFSMSKRRRAAWAASPARAAPTEIGQKVEGTREHHVISVIVFLFFL